MIKTENFQKLEITERAQLREWLNQHYKQTESIWLVTFKKSQTNKYVSRWDVLDELICFGWIDGVRRKLDDEKTMQLISPRRVEHWSNTYKERASKLILEGRMHESGFWHMENSKKAGLWDFLDDVDKLILPDDLMKALELKPQAKDFFLALNPSSKRFALRWLKLSKTSETRIKRINQLVQLSLAGEKLPGS